MSQGQTDYHLRMEDSSPRMPIPYSSKRAASEDESEGGVELAKRVDTPKMYRVMLLNDDFTPMDFVTLILKRFFGKSDEEAQQIMLDVHKQGAGTAGVFTLEMAEMKVMQVSQFARSNQHPLKSVLEPD